MQLHELYVREYVDKEINLDQLAHMDVQCPPNPSGLVYFSGIFTFERCGDIRRFGVHPILLNPHKYSSPEILYQSGEF
jgi:hypothetical protein